MQNTLLKKGLVVGITLLCIGTGAASAFNVMTTEGPKPMERSNWLYVGGSGPGNYTKIQDAINNASEGDTVFVYSGIYYEHLQTNITLRLIGENKTNTIVEENKTIHALVIKANGCDVSGFSFKNGTAVIVSIQSDSNKVHDNFFYIQSPPNEQIKGIGLEGKYNEISNNSIVTRPPSAYTYGIYVQGANNIIDHNSIHGWYAAIQDTSGNTNNTIRHCLIERNEFGIALVGSSEQIINNTFSWNSLAAIFISHTNGHLIQDNTFINNNYAEDVSTVLLYKNEHVTIIGNTFSQNLGTPLKLEGSDFCTISQNNFIDNGRNAYEFLGLLDIPKRNVWFHNYWSDTNENLLGWQRVRADLFLFAFLFYFQVTIRWPTFDRYPAQEPYDIPGIG